MQLALMIEGQNGIDWPRWQRVAAAAEELGFVGLFRSDHYTNAIPPELDSLELWTSLTWLATNTKRLRFGPVVAPVTFRHPAMNARVALQIDALAGGRLSLGLGAGWQAREHHMFGLDLLDMKSRFDRFAEALEITARLVRDDGPVTFEGCFYQLRDAVLKPRATPSPRPDGPTTATPILVGGNGERRTLPLAARWADEWNAVMIPPHRFETLNAHLDTLLVEAGRPPRAVRRSIMQGLRYGQNDAAFDRALAVRAAMWGAPATRQDLRERGEIVGVGVEVIDSLAAYEDAGVECIMLQWLDVDNLDGLRHFADVAARWLR